MAIQLMEEELSSLIRKLNDEAAFVQSEKKHIVDLYKEVLKKSEHLFHKQWIIGRQHTLIEDLIYGRHTSKSSNPTLIAKQTCSKHAQLNNRIQFIESHRLLGHHDYYVSECLKQLRDNPTTLASYLVKSELKHQYIQYQPIINNNNNDHSIFRHNSPTNNNNNNAHNCINNSVLISNQHLIPIVFQSLYGNCVLIQDELHCLQLLKSLIELQFTQRPSLVLSSSSSSSYNNNNNNNNNNLKQLSELFSNNIDLRKLIRKQTCSFNILFKYYTSFAYSTQLFLTTALREPITQLLTDEWFLDIDADKALGRFSSEELIARFGPTNSKEHKIKTAKYRDKIVAQLHAITVSFVESISSNLFCFPASMAWLVNQLYFHVSRSSQDCDLARKLCCDLVMALFICPAICDPEPYGIIVDIQISSVARHNLMQIANILQVLAMSDDDKDMKAQDLYCKFKHNCVSDILNSIIAPNIRKNYNQSADHLINTDHCVFAFDPIQSTFLSMFNNNNSSNEVASSSISSLSVASSSVASQFNTNPACLLTRSSVIISLQDLHKILIYLRQLTKELPPESEELKWLKSIIPSDYLNQQLDSTVTQMNTSNTTNRLSVASNNNNNSLSRRQSDQNLIAIQTLGAIVYTVDSFDVINSLLKEPESLDEYQILVVNINDKSLDCPGMLSEEKIIKEYQATLSSHSKLLTPNKSNSSFSSKKKLNRPLDQNMLDFKDANALNKVPSFGMMIIDRDDMNSMEGGISETCETNDRSISSNDEDDNNGPDKNDDEIDDDDDNRGDGLSDFDNFSGRDTPIISGRDTSSSHSHEDLHNISSSNNISSQNRQHTAVNAASNSMNGLNQQIRSNNNSQNGLANLNNINSNNNINMNMNQREPQLLPVTVQKANREDINEKFCKFEISKTNQPVKEEQLSEAWSLDADPPESVMNDPLDDNTGNSRLNSSSSINTEARKADLINQNININNNNSNLISFDTNSENSLTKLPSHDEDNSLTLFSMTSGETGGLNAATIGSASISTSIQSSAINTTDLNDPNNLDDRYSVISDSAAWSTDLVTNSDSDLESNSPCKYTSTFSRTSSYHLSDYSTNSNNHYSNQQQQSSLIDLAAPTFIGSAQLSTLTPVPLVSSSSSNNATSYIPATASNSNSNFALNNNATKTSAKSNDSGLIDSWYYSAETDNLTFKSSIATPSINLVTTSTATATASVTSTSKNRLKSIFSSNSQSNGVKFSLKSNNSVSTSIKPRGGLHRIFSINKNKNEPISLANPNLPQSTPFTISEINSVNINQSDNIDNILKKYKPTNNSNTNNGTRDSILIDISTPPAIINTNEIMPKNLSSNSIHQQQQSQPNEIITFDLNNPEQSKLFIDAKKKMRNILSWSDSFSFLPLGVKKNPKENFLRMYLKTQLYETISNEDKEKEAQLHETIRCVSKFSDKDCQKLLRSLKSDYTRRIPYITYLTKSKQNILQSLSLIEKLQQRSKWYQTVCTHNLASVVTRSFLNSAENEKQINSFLTNFRQLQTVDEKFDSFKIFIKQLKIEFSSIWNECDADTIELSCVCLERLIMPKVYRLAMFPNGEIDHYRDTKVFECFNELSNIITPSHPLIGIPQIYENECPWTAAQMELRRLNVYKTPQDKLACIKNCLLTIQNLLAMAKSPVCADDLHPVLIYVIIKANPPTFLSNVQYIEGFYGNQLESEDYYWAQFIFAFSYIKANMLSTI